MGGMHEKEKEEMEMGPWTNDRMSEAAFVVETFIPFQVVCPWRKKRATPSSIAAWWGGNVLPPLEGEDARTSTRSRVSLNATI